MASRRLPCLHSLPSATSVQTSRLCLLSRALYIGASLDLSISQVSPAQQSKLTTVDAILIGASLCTFLPHDAWRTKLGELVLSSDFDLLQGGVVGRKSGSSLAEELKEANLISHLASQEPGMG